MAVFGITGTIGSGKTLLMTFFSLLESSMGSRLFANYFIDAPNGVEKIDKISDLTKFMTPEKKIFSLDELWLTADSRNSMSDISQFCAKSVLLSRKINSDIYYTTQHLGQVEKRIRDITALVYHPNIIAWHEGKPILMKVCVFKPGFNYGNLEKVKNFIIPLIFNDKYICDLYNTDEIIDSMEEPEEDIIEEMSAKYLGWNGTKVGLEGKLQFEEGLKKTLAKDLARYICSLNS